MLIGCIAVGNGFCLLLYKIAPGLGATIDVLMMVLPLVFLGITLTMRPMLRPRRVYNGLAWFAGAGVEFLDSLPELNARTGATSEAVLG